MIVGDEDILLPLSGLQHLAFCERQWGLIHLENAWAENRLTAEGMIQHERAHETETTESRGDLRIARAVRLRSFRLGLSGIADMVEFRRADSDDPGAVALRDVPGKWMPFPVEYKHGKPKPDPCDEIQLCAQAMCCEEMLGLADAEHPAPSDTRIPAGSLYYGKTHHRHDVAFSDDLRRMTTELAARMHMLHAAGRTPVAAYEPKCRSCSLVEICMPKSTGGKTASRFLAAGISAAIAGVADEPESAVAMHGRKRR